MDTIGEKLKAARIENRMSQIEVAERLLVSRQTISKWENDVCLPDLENFRKICGLYHLSSNEILNLDHLSDNAMAKESTPPGNTEPGNHVQQFDSLYFLLPFFFVFFIVNHVRMKTSFCPKEMVLLFFNVLFTVFLICFIYSTIPRTTTQVLTF